MNKKLIQKFLNKACYDGQSQYELEDWCDVEKFAELIVAECCIALNPMLRDMVSRGQAFDLIKQHFGVEE
jgi:hypothetical protein